MLSDVHLSQVLGGFFRIRLIRNLSRWEFGRMGCLGPSPWTVTQSMVSIYPSVYLLFIFLFRLQAGLQQIW